MRVILEEGRAQTDEPLPRVLDNDQAAKIMAAAVRLDPDAD